MHIAQFVQRYPPALGGSEAYTARLCAYLAASGDTVTVWTSTAVELVEMWQNARRVRSVSPPGDNPDPMHPAHSSMGSGASYAYSGGSRPPFAGVNGVSVMRFSPLTFPGRRYVLKAFSLLPHRRWQCLTAPCNPVCPGMWRATNHYDGPLDAVHATAFPYSFPIVCGLRLARRRGVPFLVTPFLHLGDPTNPHDRTRRQYTAPHLCWLLKQADRVFVQTNAERAAVVSLGVPEARVVLQGLGVEAGECTGGNRAAIRAGWHVAPGAVVIGHLANNSTEKGTVDLLRAAERAWAAGHQFRVVVAGPEMASFRDFWTRFAHKDRVMRLGVLTDAQKRDFFAGIDCFALPSRSDSFGLVLLESWANAKPPLVYRAGGPAELVRDDHDGLHCACGDVNHLAAQLVRLVTDAPLRVRLGKAGHVRVGREFDWRDKLEVVRVTIRDAIMPHGPVRFSPRGVVNRYSSARISE